MMAARRTLIATQTIYTVAGRSKGTPGRGGCPRALVQLVELLGWTSDGRGGGVGALCTRSHDMPGGGYGHEQLPVIFREAAASALVTPPPSYRTSQPLFQGPTSGRIYFDSVFKWPFFFFFCYLLAPIY